MTSVLDATALLAILLGEPGAEEASEAALRGGVVTAVNFAEVRDRVLRRSRNPAKGAAAVDGLVDRRLSVLACDRTLASRASELRTAYYHPSTSAISLADCFAIAAAEARGAVLVTSDRNQVAAAVAAGVDVRPIPNSSGVRADLQAGGPDRGAATSDPGRVGSISR